MTVTVNLYSAEQEKTLIDFLEKMHFDFQSDQEDFSLTDDQKAEILRRDNDFVSGKTTARNWDDIKRDLKSVYR